MEFQLIPGARALSTKLLLPFGRYGLISQVILGRNATGEISGPPAPEQILRLRSRIDRSRAETGQREWERPGLSR